MNIVLLLAGSFTALGIGYFILDAYRHRSQTATQPRATTADSILSSAESSVSCLEVNDLQAAEQTVSHVGHAAVETVEASGNIVEHAVEAIARASAEVVSHIHH
jgi:hypothetical protein